MERHHIFILVLISVFMITFSPAIASSGPQRVSTDMQANRISLTTGKSIIVESQNPVTRVSIAAPEIADALVLTPYQIYLTGRTPGVTNLTLWNGSGRNYSAVYDVEVLPDTVRLKEKLHETLPREDNIKVTSSPDGITLMGTVSSAAGLSQVLAIAQSYAPKDKDGKSRVLNLLEVGGVQQVMLEVRVSEMSRSTMRRLGFNWNYISRNGSSFGISTLNNLTIPDKGVARPFMPGAAEALPRIEGFPANPVFPTGTINYIFRFFSGGASWTGFIDALKENGLTKVLAEPTLITLSGRTAHFLAGGEYPIPVPQSSGAGGTVITIDYKPFGVGLNFTPTVLDSGKISMQVAPEVSDLDFSKAIMIQGYVVPSINTRRVSTMIELADGQSFAIAGLLRDDVREVVDKYPLLGDIPILGALFRSTSFQKNESELVIIVTAHLVKPLDLKKQTLPTDQYVEPNDFEFYLLGATEGSGGGKDAKASGSTFLRKGGGLEGEFGYILN